MKSTSKFYPRPMFKYELAELYNVSKNILFSTWLKKETRLQEELYKYHYNNSRKLLTQKQVEIIFNYFGLPKNFTIDETKKVDIRPYSKQEIANFYGIDSRTFANLIKILPESTQFGIYGSTNRFIRRLNVRRKYFTPREIELIFANLGHPYYENSAKFIENEHLDAEIVK